MLRQSLRLRIENLRNKRLVYVLRSSTRVFILDDIMRGFGPIELFASDSVPAQRLQVDSDDDT